MKILNWDLIRIESARSTCELDAEGGGWGEGKLMQPLRMVWLRVPVAADHENNEVPHTRRPHVLIPFRDLLVYGRWDFV
jgi:hypothetical protein